MSADEQMNWLRALVDMERETGDPEEFLDSLRYEISGDEVYVFTPKGEVVVLPRGATPVDFAYSVHTEVGNRTVGAKVNGRLVPLNTRLESGQTVEVVTSKSDKAGPSRDWLAFVASPRARSKIKAWFSRERKEEAVEAGKESIARAMRKQNLPLQRLMNHDSVLSVATSLGYPDISGLYAAVGDGHISAQNIVSKLVENLGGGDGTEETLSEGVTPGAHLHSAPELSAKGQGFVGIIRVLMRKFPVMTSLVSLPAVKVFPFTSARAPMRYVWKVCIRSALYRFRGAVSILRHSISSKFRRKLWTVRACLQI